MICYFINSLLYLLFKSIEDLEETLSPLIGRIMDQREAQMFARLDERARIIDVVREAIDVS